MRTAALVAVGALACVAHRREPAKHMQEVAYVNPTPGSGEATIIFLRLRDNFPQTSVFELPEHGPARLIGVLSGRYKMAHTTTPGRHTFMVIGGGSTDFMGADLMPNKVYSVLVALHLETFREFSLQPIHGVERDQFRTWLADAIWVETTHASLTWAHENAADIEDRRARYHPKWLERPPAERLALQPEDGQ